MPGLKPCFSVTVIVLLSADQLKYQWRPVAAGTSYVDIVAGVGFVCRTVELYFPAFACPYQPVGKTLHPVRRVSDARGIEAAGPVRLADFNGHLVVPTDWPGLPPRPLSSLRPVFPKPTLPGTNCFLNLHTAIHQWLMRLKRHWTHHEPLVPLVCLPTNYCRGYFFLGFQPVFSRH